MSYYSLNDIGYFDLWLVFLKAIDSSHQRIVLYQYEAELILGEDFGDDATAIFGIGGGGSGGADGLLESILFLKWLQSCCSRMIIKLRSLFMC